MTIRKGEGGEENKRFSSKIRIIQGIDREAGSVS